MSSGRDLVSGKNHRFVSVPRHLSAIRPVPATCQNEWATFVFSLTWFLCLRPLVLYDTRGKGLAVARAAFGNVPVDRVEFQVWRHLKQLLGHWTIVAICYSFIVFAFVFFPSIKTHASKHIPFQIHNYGPPSYC